jgi:hypothetical protein
MLRRARLRCAGEFLKRRGGTSGLRAVHHGGPRVELSAKSDGPENGADGSEHEQLGFHQGSDCQKITAVIDAVRPGSYTEVEIPE